MRHIDERARLLTEQGFSDYQARAYVALLEFSSCTVAELAKVARIPRNRLYEVLADLQGMGLVHVHLESPRRYRANPLADYLDRRVKELDERKDHYRFLAEAVAPEFAPPPVECDDVLSMGRTRVLSGRRSVAREVERLIEQAMEEVTVSISDAGFRRTVNYVRLGLARRAKDAPALRLSLHVPEKADVTDADLRSARDIFGDAIHRIGSCLRECAFVADRRELLLVQAIPEDDHARRGEDFALLTTNPALIHDHLSLLTAARVA